MATKDAISASPSYTKDRDLLSARYRGEAAIVGLILFAVLISWLPRMSGPLDLRWDGGVYYVLGASLAEGKGYKLLNEPGEIAATQYPPLLPAFIALHQQALGTNDHLIVGRWLRITYFIIFNIYILTIYLLARLYLKPKYALLATLVCLFSLHTYFLSDLCFPEIPFALATTLFFIFNRKDGSRASDVLAGLFAVMAYGLRTSGIALLAAWIGEGILKRQFKKAVLRAVISGCAVLGWFAYISVVENSEQYKKPVYEYQRAGYLFYNVSYNKNIFPLKDPFAPELGAASAVDLVARFMDNLKSIPVAVGEIFSTTKKLWETEWMAINRLSPVALGKSRVVVMALMMIGALVLGGVFVLLFERQWIIPLYVLLSIAAMCITPFPGQFNRYLTPIAPFLAISLFNLLSKFRETSRTLSRTKWSCVGGAVLTAVVMIILSQQLLTFYLAQTRWRKDVVYNSHNGTKASYRLYFYFDAYRVFDSGVDWLKLNAAPGDVVASSMPQWVYLRTGLKSIMPPFESNPSEAQRLLDTVPVKYLILDEGLALDTRKYTYQVVNNYPEKWRRVYSDSIITENNELLTDRFQIYMRLP